MPERILLTFTGFHDPFVETATQGVRHAGPVLTVVAERSFDAVYLFSTPKAAEISKATRAAIEAKHPDIEVEVCDVPLKDPTNYLGILRQLRRHFRTIQQKHSEHLLLRLMRRMRETQSESNAAPDLQLTPDAITIVFVETMDGRSIYREMPLNERGELVKAWPGGFFEEDLEELM